MNDLTRRIAHWGTALALASLAFSSSAEAQRRPPRTPPAAPTPPATPRTPEQLATACITPAGADTTPASQQATALACAEGGHAYAELGQHDRAANLFRNGCLRGDADSCRLLGAMQLLGRDIPRDYVQALTNFRAACDRGHAAACFDAGRMLESGLRHNGESRRGTPQLHASVRARLGTLVHPSGHTPRDERVHA